ncbi:nucleoside-diphosphate-sugar epimerase [Caulobacter sp. AP07]|uniref:NAD-dependent epimerase/dehydratase family protein n=1 Tax=Caulobacter sp. AP07 TaxID=1144304 RepID=UPI0002721B15|nr:NAD-dependent epimerase/dehydratase family protein [Caulobacter sp. AP07]EJL33368.1 nucleoside-diphosphate-sugar epimerase [Caulobacter sp. AP07]
MTLPLYDLSGRKVLVTGGAGFIGSRTVDHLLMAGAGEIVVVDDMVRGRRENLAVSLASGRVRLVRGDICDRVLMSDLVNGSDTVFHLAALRITQCAAEPRRAVEVMVNATYDLLETCVEANVRKVVMASSASIYGMASSFPTREDHNPYANRTLYGAAKAFGEGLLRTFNDMHGLDYVAMRYFNAYGPRMDVHGRYTEVLIRWMERVDAGLPPIVFGAGDQTLDMVHVDDIARANVLAACAPASDVALNIGSGSETSLARLAELIVQAMGGKSLLLVHEPERAVNPVPRRLADISLAAERIGYAPRVSLEDGLRDLVAWWREEKHGTAGAKGQSA